MKTNHVIIIFAAAILLAVVFYSLQSGSNDQEYMAAIEKERVEKDDFMRSGEGSPFAGREGEFRGLAYFAPNPKYRVQADLEPVSQPNMRLLQTSDSKEAHYMEYAWATFTLDGVKNRLLILEVVDPGPFKGTLFLAFADASSAIETYGAGRYLDVKKVPGATTVLLDFNKAYNPYCAYADSFSCPFPPKENLLSIPVLAGEKSYGDH